MPEKVVSTLVKFFYEFVNEGMPENATMVNPLTDGQINTKDFFKPKIINHRGGSGDFKLIREINKEYVLSKKIDAIFNQLNTKNLKPHNINVLFLPYVDVDLLDSIIGKKIPDAKPRLEKKRRDYLHGDDLILSITRNLKRIIFFPHEGGTKEKPIYTPDELALDIIDTIHDGNIYIKVEDRFNKYFLNENGTVVKHSNRYKPITISG